MPQACRRRLGIDGDAAADIGYSLMGQLPGRRRNRSEAAQHRIGEWQQLHHRQASHCHRQKQQANGAPPGAHPEHYRGGDHDIQQERGCPPRGPHRQRTEHHPGRNQADGRRRHVHHAPIAGCLTKVAPAACLGRNRNWQHGESVRGWHQKYSGWQRDDRRGSDRPHSNCRGKKSPCEPFPLGPRTNRNFLPAPGGVFSRFQGEPCTMPEVRCRPASA